MNEPLVFLCVCVVSVLACGWIATTDTDLRKDER
jgi:hypothetical protein